MITIHDISLERFESIEEIEQAIKDLEKFFEKEEKSVDKD